MNEQVDIFELAKNVPIRDILEKLGFAIKVHSNNREAEITDRKLVSEFNEKWRVNFVKNQVRSYPVDYLPSGGPVRFVRTYLFGSDQSKEGASKTAEWFRSSGLVGNFGSAMKPDMREFNNYIEAAKKENVEMSTRLDAERSKNQVVLANVYAKLNPQISDKAREYFKGRGISEKTVLENGGRTGKIIHKGKDYIRCFLPHLATNGNITGVRARNVYTEAIKNLKSFNLPDSQPGLLFTKKNLEAIKRKKLAVIAEGEMDKMSLDEMGVETAIGNIAGALQFPEVWKEIFAECETVAILYDDDLWGRYGVAMVKQDMLHDKNIVFFNLKNSLDIIGGPTKKVPFPKDINDLLDIGLERGLDAHEIWGAIKKTFFRIDDKFVEKAYLEVQKYRESKKLDLMKNLNVLPVSESESEKSEITQKTENKTEIKGERETNTSLL